MKTMMNKAIIIEDKVEYFKYMLFKLIEWHKYNSGRDDLSSFTRIKIHKLLFLVSAVRDDSNVDLLDIFNGFYAMQHGPVESDIYNAMINSSIDCFSFKNINMEQLKSFDEVFIANKEDYKLIDDAINRIKSVNEKIILYSASELVNITHKWGCWQVAFEIAKMQGKGSSKMDINKIRSDYKYFGL